MRLIDADELLPRMFPIDSYGKNIDFVRSAPTIEAIPNEWMKKWAKHRKEIGYDLDEVMVEDMLQDWEKRE